MSQSSNVVAQRELSRIFSDSGMSAEDVTAPRGSDSASDRDSFDERFYLEQYPDVARAVASGRLLSGWHHYSRVGRTEGRKARQLTFDAEFYLKSYPGAEEEIRSGLAQTAEDHFARFGKARGFLGHRSAQRPDNPSAPVSRFGGLWPDCPNVLDLIEGKLEIGQITEPEAELLTHWTHNGYVVLSKALPDDVVDRARIDLDRAYSGQIPNQMFECSAVAGDRRLLHWCPEINQHPAKALDIHFLSSAVRDAIFHSSIERFLKLLFESMSCASQSLGFLRGSAQEAHQDTAYVAYTRPRNFAASWIALEDVTSGAGELFYYPRSHKLEDYLFGGQYKTINDCRRMNDGKLPKQEGAEFVRSLELRTVARRMQKTSFLAKKGDVFIWHADLVHGGNPVSKEVTRKSIVTHYCPAHLSPLFSEDRRIKLHRHNGHRFTTGLYLATDPGN